MPVHVHVNCAVTLDGCLGGPGRTRLRISNAEDMRRVHELRAQSDAIMVGVGTVATDDPKLTVKWELLGRQGKNPLRVVLDPQLRTPPESRVRNGDAPTLFFARRNVPGADGLDVERVRAPRNELDLGEVLERLATRGVKRLMLEGGAGTLTRFFQRDRVDSATIFVSPRVLGAHDAPRLTESETDLRQRLELTKAEKLGDGALLTFARRGI